MACSSFNQQRQCSNAMINTRFNAFNWNICRIFSALILPSRNVEMFGTFYLQIVQLHTKKNQCNPLQNIHGREQQQHKKMRKLVKLYVCVREHCHWCCFYSVEFWLFAWLNFCLLLSPSLSVSVTVTVLVQIIAKRYSIVQTVVFFSHTLNLMQHHVQ